MHCDAKKLFQISPFYNTFIEKPDIEKLSSENYCKNFLFMMN